MLERWQGFQLPWDTVSEGLGTEGRWHVAEGLVGPYHGFVVDSE